jgi:hypothetical protein
MESIGLIWIRDHLLFTWREREFGRGPRRIEITPAHCEACIRELRGLEQGGAPIEYVDLRAGLEDLGKAPVPSK